MRLRAQAGMQEPVQPVAEALEPELVPERRAPPVAGPVLVEAVVLVQVVVLVQAAGVQLGRLEAGPANRPLRVLEDDRHLDDRPPGAVLHLVDEAVPAGAHERSRDIEPRAVTPIARRQADDSITREIHPLAVDREPEAYAG